MSSYSEGAKVDISLLFRLLLSNWKFIVFYFIFIISISIIQFQYTEPTYKSQSTILVTKCYSNGMNQITGLSSCQYYDYLDAVLKSNEIYKRFIDYAKNNVELSKLNEISGLTEEAINTGIADLKIKHLLISPNRPRRIFKVSYLTSNQSETALLTNAFTNFVVRDLEERNFEKFTSAIERIDERYSSSSIEKNAMLNIQRELQSQRMSEVGKIENHFEIIDTAITPNARFQPSLRLIFAQNIILGFFLLVIAYLGFVFRKLI